MDGYIFDQKPALEDLVHYGVKGMKWGVRNERKGSGSVGVDATTKVLIGYGAAFAGVLLAQRAVLYKDSGRKDARKTGDKGFKKNPSLKAKMSVNQLHEKVVKPINPKYGEKGTKMNCRRATMAYEMRRRGNDVKATRSTMASGQTTKGLKTAIGYERGDKLESIWGEKNIGHDRAFVRSSPQAKADTIFKEIGKNPNGARGELGVSWIFGGGHSVAWEVVNNKPVIFDTQNGLKYDSPAAFAKFTPVVVEAAQTRLDNKQLDTDFLKRWVTDV